MLVAEQDVQVHEIITSLQRQLETAKEDNVRLREQWGEAFQVCMGIILADSCMYVCMYVGR